MVTDWHLVAQIAVPIATLFIGAWVNRWFEKRPALISYFGHVSAFKYSLQDGKQVDIYTHSVVLRNSGRRSATNVRLRHHVLPDFQIIPSVEHRVVELTAGAKEILIPTMVPGEQLTVSYLYFPPLTYAGINAGIRSDEGFASAIPVLLQRQYPKWFGRVMFVLALIGAGSIIYSAISFARHLVK